MFFFSFTPPIFTLLVLLSKKKKKAAVCKISKQGARWMMHQHTLKASYRKKKQDKREEASQKNGEQASSSESVWTSSWISICSSCSHLFLTRGTCGPSLLLRAEVNVIIWWAAYYCLSIFAVEIANYIFVIFLCVGGRGAAPSWLLKFINEVMVTVPQGEKLERCVSSHRLVGCCSTSQKSV